jgi:hypothetical protein
MPRERIEEAPEHRVGRGRALVQEYRNSRCYDKVVYLTRYQSEKGCGSSGFQRLHLDCENLDGYLGQSYLESGELYLFHFTSRTTSPLMRICKGSNRLKGKERTRLRLQRSGK